RIADRNKEVAQLRRRHPGVSTHAYAFDHHWDVDYRTGDRIRLDVMLDSDGRFLRTWTGLPANAFYARGHYGGLLLRPWVFLPFELIFPNNGEWDSLPAAHAATLFFDLLTIVGLVLLGRRLRAGPEGTRLGLALGWAWAAFPFTLWAVMENTNDGMISALIVF